MAHGSGSLALDEENGVYPFRLWQSERKSKDSFDPPPPAGGGLPRPAAAGPKPTSPAVEDPFAADLAK